VAFSGEAHLNVWTEEALHTHPAWAQFRQRAADVLAAFGWPQEIPPGNGAIYIGPSGA
jgi:hypothetical protein